MRPTVRPKFKMTTALGCAIAISAIASACGSSGSKTSASSSTTAATAASAAGEAGALDENGCVQPQPLDNAADATIVSTINIETFAPALLADHFGEFEKENLNVKMVSAPSNEGTVMVANGQAQLKLAGITASFLNAVDNGIDSVWIANIHQNSPESQEGVWLRSDFFDESGKVIPEKLDGAKIAPGSGGVGSIASFQINEFLKENGRSLADINIVAMGGSDMLVALENGSIDGGYILTPQWLELVGGDTATYVGLYGQDEGADRSAMYEMSKSFIEGKPEVAKALIRAISRSICTYLQSGYHDDPEVVAALVELTGSTPEDIQRSPELSFDPTMPLYDGIITGAQEMWLEYAPDTLNYTDPIPVDEITYHDLVDQALNP